MAALVLFVALLILPVWAGMRLFQRFDGGIITIYLIVVSGLTFWLYWDDKRRAETGGWRTPESILHLAELLGGWPAAFCAQRLFRHKISKTRYQVLFWLIVVLHQVMAFDFVHDWHYARTGLSKLFRL